MYGGRYHKLHVPVPSFFPLDTRSGEMKALNDTGITFIVLPTLSILSIYDSTTSSTG
jgi:hypothetical protein